MSDSNAAISNKGFLPCYSTLVVHACGHKDLACRKLQPSNSLCWMMKHLHQVTTMKMMVKMMRKRTVMKMM